MNEMNIPAIRFAGFAEDWEKRKLSAIASIKARIGWQGLTQKEFLDGGDYYLITGTDFAEGTIDFPNCHYIGEDRYKQDTNIQVKARDVLITKDGTIGKVAYIKELDKPATLNAGVFVIRGRDESTSNLYMYHYLAAPFLLDYADEQATGGTIKHLNQNVLVNFPVPMPSVAEQEKVGQFFSAVNDLITLHQREHDKTVNIKKALLEKMFPKDGEDNPEIRFAGFTNAWEQRKLGDLMNVTSVKRIHQSDWTNIGVRFLRARDIISAAKGEHEKSNDYLYISKEKYEEYTALSGKVSIGDLLVTGVGTIGIPLLINNIDPLYFKDGNIIWFQNKGMIDGNFLYYSFWSSNIRDFINESAGIGTVGTYTIESGKKTPIFLPRLNEQVKIGELFLSLDRLIALHQRELTKLQNIKKALLEKMFV